MPTQQTPKDKLLDVLKLFQDKRRAADFVVKRYVIPKIGAMLKIARHTNRHGTDEQIIKEYLSMSQNARKQKYIYASSFAIPAGMPKLLNALASYR